MFIGARWRWILDRILDRTGHGFLIPFIDGLSHLGRPSEFLLPPELIGQGLSVFLSGLNNTMAVQSNPDWIWPYWAERQSDPDSADFQPTALNVIKGNLTHRNWTSLGLPDSAKECMLDPVGMLTLHAFGWSVFPYVRWEGELFCPPRLEGRVKQSLRDGILPCVMTEYSAVPGLDWSSETLAVDVEGEELARFAHTLRNRTGRSLALVFGLALRPYNALTIGHINRIRYKNRLWRINRRPGLLLCREPDRILVSDRHRGDPLERDLAAGGSAYLESKSGIAAGIAEYHLRLEPDQSWTLETAGLLGLRRGAPNANFRHVNEASLQKARDVRVAAWDVERKMGLKIRIPDAKLQAAFEAVKLHLAVFDDGDHFSPGTFLYHHPWIRDGAYLALANENMGFPERVASKLDALIRCQDRAGYFRSQRGEWDSNGQALFTMVNHVKMGGDPAQLERHFPKMMEGARWIEKTRGENRKSPSLHFGLLPAGFSAEHFGPNDHYYWDNFWSLAGLQSAQWLARQLGREKEARWLGERGEEYRQDLESSFQCAFEKLGSPLLPCSPYRRMDTAAIGNLVAVSPLGLFSHREPWVRNTTAFLVRNNMRDGLFFQKIVHTGLNPYLSVQLARVLLLQGNPSGHEVLRALLLRATPTLTWPEAMHPRSFGGCMGDGDHGWAAAEFLNLVREMLVTVEAGELRLAPYLPQEWMRPGLDLRIEDAPTVHGTVSYALKAGADTLAVTWSIRRQRHQDAGKPVLCFPRRLILPGDSGRLEIPLSESPGIFSAAELQPTQENA